jgi:DNA-directed RNA polymerase specialized sigma24 family protein
MAIDAHAHESRVLRLVGTEASRSTSAIPYGIRGATDLDAVNRHVLALTKREVMNVADRESIAARVLFDVLEHADRNPGFLDRPDEVERYASVGTFNQLRNYARREQRRRRREKPVTTDTEQIAEHSSVLDELLHAEGVLVANRVLEKQPKAIQELWAQVRVAGESLESVAKERGMTVNALSIRLSRTKNTIRRAIEKYLRDGEVE